MQLTRHEAGVTVPNDVTVAADVTAVEFKTWKQPRSNGTSTRSSTGPKFDVVGVLEVAMLTKV